MVLPYLFYIIPTCSILTLLSAITCIASKSTSSYSYYAARHSGKAEASIILETEIPKERTALAPYPYYLGLNASTVVLAASSIALVISVGFTALSAFVMLKRYPIKLSYYCKQAVLFLLLANASLALAATITSFILHSRSEHFSLSYRSLNGGFGYSDVYEFGVFDLETWTCEINKLPSFRSRDVSKLGQQCAAETSARICTVITFVFALSLFSATWWDTKKYRTLIAVAWENDPMACDDEDDCELDDVATNTQLRIAGLRIGRV